MKFFAILFALVGVSILCIVAAPYNGRIIGGETAADGQLPYQVSLQIYGQHFCGGSILSENYIISAAHCFYGQPVSVMKVVAGINKLSDTTAKAQQSSVAEVKFFGYDPNTITNDLVVVKLATPFTLNSKVQKIGLFDGFVGGSVELIASGWGRFSETSQDIPNDLQFVKIQSITNSKCQQTWPIDDRQICTSTEDFKGTCNGDSGGPLVKMVNGQAQLVGLVSFGAAAGCAIGYPTAYTRVYSFKDTILNAIQ